MKNTKKKKKLSAAAQAAKDKIISLNKTLNGIDYLDDSEAKRYSINLCNTQKEELFNKFPILKDDEECIKPEPQRSYCSSIPNRETSECGPTTEG